MVEESGFRTIKDLAKSALVMWDAEVTVWSTEGSPFDCPHDLGRAHIEVSLEVQALYDVRHSK